MLSAARNGRSDVVALLLELGVSVDVADATGLRALQAALPSGHLEIARLLLAHGAEVDRPTAQYDGAMGFAAHFGQREIAALMAPRNRDVHNLTRLGLKQRLAELFANEPVLVNSRHFRSGVTPLFMLPADEDDAADMAVFLLEHGADASIQNRDGLTPEAAQRAQGLDEVAEFLRDEGAHWPRGRA
ncbi:MAG: ankyrin repeat domain-containing protein [Burkholderiales bacterium]